MRRSFVALSGILWAVTFSLPAREPPAGRGNQFFDSLLDHLVGDWHVTRKFASGRMAENAVHAEWVLNHQFMELHYLDVARPSKYEAMVFIGYDTNQERYICHWIDVFGGEFSGLAEGNLDRGGHAIEFTFKNPDGKFTNRFTFDPESQSWTSLMRQEARGEWKLFAEDKSPRSLGSERWSGDPDRWRSARILFLAEGEQTSEAVMARLTAFIGEAKLRFRFLRHAL